MNAKDPPRSRGSRTPRSTGALLALSARDLDALALIGEMRFVTVEQIVRAELGFSSANYAAKRLRSLAKGGLVDVLLVHARQPNLYRLTRRGLGVLRAERPQESEGIQIPGLVDLGGLLHHLTIVDARLYCSALGRRRRAPLVDWQGGAGPLAKQLGFPATGLIPDGLAVFAVGEAARVVIAVEVDTGTEGGMELARKFARYTSVAESMAVDALWLVVAAGDGRQQTIQRLVDAAGLGQWSRVMGRAHVVERPVAELPARGARGRDMAAGHNREQSRR